MLPLTAQVRIATDMSKGGAARLANVDIPKFEDDETTVEQLKARLLKTIAFLKGLDAAKFVGAEDRHIHLKFPQAEFNFDGKDYLNNWVLPNVYFHIATGYDILRHKGRGAGQTGFPGRPKVSFVAESDGGGAGNRAAFFRTRSGFALVPVPTIRKIGLWGQSMAAETYRYRAFISYRHVERDRRWARWLIEKLETFRTPKTLVRAGAPLQIGHLFRDDDEIPASSDLSHQIEDALKASQFLIVVCSRDTPKSQWVGA